MFGRLKMPQQLEQASVVVDQQSDEEHRHQQQQDAFSNMEKQLEAIRGQIRIVKLRQSEANSRLGFSLRGGKELTGSSVGVFVSHVEPSSEAEAKGLQIGDRLIQVDGLDVNQATYEEVVGLIKKAPKSDDILLKVTNLGRIPVQDKSGEPIKWVEVLDLLEMQQLHSPAVAEASRQSNQQRQQQQVKQRSAPRSSHNVAKGPAPIPPTMANNTSNRLATNSSSSSGNSSSDEGIASCDSHRNQVGAESSSFLSDSSSASELLADQAELAVRQVAYCSPSKTATMRTNSNSLGGDDSAVSSTLTCSGSSSSSSSVTAASNEAYDDEECSLSSACSVSISSVQSSIATTTSGGRPSIDNTAAVAPRFSAANGCQMQETLVRVPGGRRTSQPFGCEVVKGPDEWPGIFVQNVKPNSLAERLGLQLGDELARANGRLLSELSFESAIELIKQLQQQHDELELHVRKGAALEHLASSKQQAQHQTTKNHYSNTNHHHHHHHHQQQQQQQEQQNLGDRSATASNSCVKSTATKRVAVGAASIAPQANKAPLTTSEASPVGGLTTTKAAGEEAAAAAGGADLKRPPSSVAGGSCSNTATSRVVAVAGSKQSKGRSGNSGSSGTCAGDPISGTQSQLSGKEEHKNSSSGASNSKSNYNAALVVAPVADVNMEMCTDLSSPAKSSAKLAAGGSSDWLEQRDRKQSAPIGAAGCNQLDAGKQAQSQAKTTRETVLHQLIGHQQQQQGHQFEFREDCLDNSPASKTCSTRIDPAHPNTTATCKSHPREEQTANETTAQEDFRFEQEQSFGDVARMSESCEPEPEIRIVSQNCKLHLHNHHHQQPHSAAAMFHSSFKQSSFVHESLAHHHPLAAKLQQKENQEHQDRQEQLRLQHQQARTVARKAQLVAATAVRRQQQQQISRLPSTVDNIRRQLDGPRRSSLLQAHRYLSMDNLASCSQQQQQSHLQQSQRRQQLQHRSRYGYSPGSLAASETNSEVALDYQAGPPSARTRLSQRSRSLLGQQALCCQQPDSSSSRVGNCGQPGSKTLTARPSKESSCLPTQTTTRVLQPRRLLRLSCQRSCCSQQQHAYLAAGAAGRQYSSHTLGAPLVLARSKAFSMDKLNLLDSACSSAGSSPLKMGPPSSGCARTVGSGLARSHRQHFVVGGCSGGASKQLRALVGQRHLLMSAASSPGCCSQAAILGPSQAPARCSSPAVRSLASTGQQQPPTTAVYKYATTAGLIVAAGDDLSAAAGNGSGNSSNSAARTIRVRRFCCAKKSLQEEQVTSSSCCSAISSKQATTTNALYLAAPSVHCRLQTQQQLRTSNSRLSSCCSLCAPAPATSATSVTSAQDSCYLSCFMPSAAQLPNCCCCPQQVSRLHHKQLISGGCELAPTKAAASATRKQQQLTHGKRASADLSAGAATDSSGYLSAGELRPRTKLPANVIGASQQPLVTICNEDNQNRGNNGGQKRDTRQRLTTFLASPGQQQSHQTMASTATAKPYSPGSTGSGTSAPASEQSLSSSASSSLSCDYANPSIANTTSSSSVSPTIIWKQQQQAQQHHTKMTTTAAASTTTKANHQNCQNEQSSNKRHSKVPCPPPLPASEAPASRLDLPLAPQQVAGDTFDRLQPVARSRKSADHTGSSNNNSETECGGKQNRLCFVDELKMLSKRQRQHSAVASTAELANEEQSATESATLIKIINANKLAAAQQRKAAAAAAAASGCSCKAGASTGGQRANNDSCPLAHNCQKQQQQQQLRLRSSHKSSHEVKSCASNGKLNEEDNKRRQHEMLMKEFKSAHSKMFNKRRGGQQQQTTDSVLSPLQQDTGETRLSRASSPIVDRQLVDNNTRHQPPHLTRRSNVTATASGVAKAIGSRKIGLLAQSQVHLAAAN